MVKYLITLMAVFGLSNIVQAETLEIVPERTLYISGPIGPDIVAQANTLVNLATASTDPVYLVINSPGGSVLPGMQFLQAMRIAKRRGADVNCVVPVMAASMAFQIFAECSNRYAFETSLLLWHPMWMNAGKLNRDQAEKVVDSFERLELPFIQTLRDELQISDEDFYKHYRWETWHTGLSLQLLSPKFFTMVDQVIGAPGIFNLRQRSNQYRKLVGPQWIAPNWQTMYKKSAK